MLIEDETKLKTWISQVVEDISDAEPDALAKYVIALIKKPLSDADLEKLCTDKLSVFLQSHTESFVARLFKTLKSGQYLPKTDAQPSAEPSKLVQQIKPKTTQKSAAEHDELVLTDGESDHDQEREELLQQKSKLKEMPQPQQLRAKAVSVLSSPRSSSTKEQQHSSSPRRSAVVAEQRPKVRAASPPSTVAATATQSSVTTAKPPRKRISPPPRSSSMERRAANRRASPLAPLRRRVVLTGGSGGGSMRISSANRLTIDRERERHHRGVANAGGSGRGTILGRSRSKSRSPHRKEKRVGGVEPEPRISSRRHRCRDFHEKGFCMRGDNCPFDHGPDPVVVENSALKDIVRDTAIFDTSTTYGVNPPPPGLENTVTPSAICVSKLSGSVTEGYNPEAPAMDNSSTVPRIDFSVPPPPLPQHFLQQQRQILYPPAPVPTASGIISTFAAVTATTTPTDASGGGVLSLRPAIDSSLGGASLRGPFPSTIAVSVSGSQPTYGGTLPGSAITTLAPTNGTSTVTSIFQQDTGGRMTMRGGRFKPYTMTARNPNTRSLLVRKIPTELNKIAQIDQHFSRFGQVTNIQVQYEGRTDSALVTFKTRREAMSAYKSTEPIFNNRFVKVFWQNDANGNTIENEDAGSGAFAENASNVPTIPLVDSNVNRKTILKEPIQFPRYFTKIFAQQKKEGADGSVSVDESTAVTTEYSDDKKAFSSDLGTTADHPPSVPELTAPQHPRPIYNPKLANMKKRAAMERERLGKLAEVQRMKTELYTKLVEQQKILLKKLQQTVDKEAKKKIVKYLKTFELKVDGVKTELEQLALKMREMQMRQPPAKRTRTGHSMSEQRPADNGAEAGSQSELIGNKIQHQSPTKYSIPNKKLLKLCRVVYVSACPSELSEKLILHMERFGELFDYDINATPQIFTYKESLDAQRAVNEAAGCFELAKLKVEWAPVAKGVKSDKDIVPDGERKPSEQVAAKDLLALLEYDEEEEDEKKGEEEQLSDKEGDE